jgi:hypothetical protein
MGHRLDKSAFLACKAGCGSLMGAFKAEISTGEKGKKNLQIFQKNACKNKSMGYNDFCNMLFFFL